MRLTLDWNSALDSTDTKIIRIRIFDKKINFTLQCSSQQNRKRKYGKPFKSNSWSRSKTLDDKELKLQP